MKRTMLCAALLTLLSAIVCAQQPRVTGSSCIVGPARITFLTPELIRLEWSSEGKWADWPSAVVVKRRWARVHIRASVDGGVAVVRSDKVTVRYRPPERFSPETLRIESPLMATSWRPGQPDPGNLGGTRHSLDGVSETDLPPLPPGLLSRSGYFFYDDSATPLINPETGWLAGPRRGGALDWYFCVYGRDYRRALALASDLFGHIFMPPRWAFGAWYSRYWPYTDEEEKEIIRKFRELGIPLDVLVIDVDWHLHGWEGYDWNPKLFPDPEGFLRWVHAYGCKVTLNNHPGALPSADSHFGEVCKRLGLNPKAEKVVRFNLADRRHAAAFMEVLHKPLHDQGVDFWWIDGSSAHMPGLNSQMWTTKVYFDYTEKFTGKRGLLFARYGGFGSHRYPVGFSGDAFSHWGVLRYEVMFTSRAGNVLYPYWSHDIGGFHGDRLPTELYVRWVQFGALSPILRLHSAHGIREPWEYGSEGIEAARKYFRLRYALLPYIYSHARRTWETGEPLCRPLYLDWPDEEEAYRRDYEYMFGDAMLVAPITAAARDGQLAEREVWLPPGRWIDFWTGQAFGPGLITYQADLQCLPIFLRAPSIVVTGPVTDFVGQRPDDHLTAIVTVGAQPVRFTVYEDDGESKGYQQGKGAVTELALSPGRNRNTDQVLTIGPARGHLGAQPQSRRWTVEVRGRLAPARVLLDGRAVPRAKSPAARPPAWTYDPQRRVTVIHLPARPLTSGYTVELRGGSGYQQYWLASRARGLAGHITSAVSQVSALPGTWDELAAQATSIASQLRKLAGDIEKARTPTSSARHALSRVKGQKLLSLAQLAAGSAANPSSRFRALAALVGLKVIPSVRATDDAKAVVLQPAIMRAGVAPAAAEELLNCLTGPNGRKWPDIGLRFSVERFYPVGMVSLALPLRGSWRGLPLATELSAEVDAGWLQLFHLVGPFDHTDYKGLDAVYPPERRIDVGAKWAGKTGPVKWSTTKWRWPTKPVATPHFVDLTRVFEPRDFVVAYAIAYVWAPTETPAVVLLGTDDECKLWLNGRLLHSYTKPRPPQPDEDKVSVRLRAGWNTILLKVCQERGQWGFYIRLAGPDGKPLRGLWTSLQPEGTPPGGPSPD